MSSCEAAGPGGYRRRTSGRGGLLPAACLAWGIALALQSCSSGRPAPDAAPAPPVPATPAAPVQPAPAPQVSRRDRSRAAGDYHDDCEARLEEARRTFRALTGQPDTGATADVLHALNELEMQIDDLDGKSTLYADVHPDADMRTSAAECRDKTRSFKERLETSPALYERVRELQTGVLDSAARRYRETLLRDFRRAGADRNAATRERIRGLKTKIDVLAARYRRNIDRDVRHVELASSDALSGLPVAFIDRLSDDAATGATVSTAWSDYLPFMTYARNDRYRLALYRARRNRAYPENTAVLKELAAARHELARLLGYPNYAAYALAANMADTPEKVRHFINTLNTIAAARAEQDHAVLLEQLHRSDPGARHVGEWQWRYLLQSSLSQRRPESFRPLQFDYTAVRDELFELTQALFPVAVIPWSNSVWDETVEAYGVYENGELIGRFYLDVRPREGKSPRSGHFAVQQGAPHRRLPVSALVFHFPADVDGRIRLTHTESRRFARHYGRLLHALFGGRQRWLRDAPARVESDFIDVPASLMEEWLWDRETLRAIAGRSTGTEASETDLDRLIAGRQPGEGLRIRQEAFRAALALHVHSRPPGEYDAGELTARLRSQYSPYRSAGGTHDYANFRELGGNRPLYYHKLWAEVLVRDLFSRFKTLGLRDPQTGARYRAAVLQPGASKPADELIEDFLGRPYNFQAFAARLNRVR